jgi:hypothetical protein
VSASAQPVTLRPLGAATVDYNAIAFNPQDNFIYGMLRMSNILVRIGSDGSTQNLGQVTGLPGLFYVAAEIGPDGAFYVKADNANQELYRIDLRTHPATATYIGMDRAVFFDDMAWHGDRLYFVDRSSSTLYSLDPDDGSVTEIGATGLHDMHFGSLYGGPDGVFGVKSLGADPGFYRFNVSTGRATLISPLVSGRSWIIRGSRIDRANRSRKISPQARKKIETSRCS